MFRYLLTAYMLMLTATGANPCCCTLSRLVGMVTTIGGTHCVAVPGPTCCGGASMARPSLVSQTPEGIGQTSEEQHAPKHSCPCFSKSCKSLPPERSAVVVDHSRSWLDHICLDWAASQVLVTVDANEWAFFAVVAPPPPPTGRQMRIALCSWRC